MNLEEVYNYLGTPSGLREHMLTVAGLALLIKECWNGEVIDWTAVITAALIHDVGNVIKFDLVNCPELLGSELPRLEYWRIEQKRLIEKYGSDDHDATDKMLQELNVSESVRAMIRAKSFGNAKETASSGDWLVKILLYCDLRVLPGGVGTLDERVDEIKGRLVKYSRRPDFLDLVAACKFIEQQIQMSMTESLHTVITNVKASIHSEELLYFKIN